MDDPPIRDGPGGAWYPSNDPGDLLVLSALDRKLFRNLATMRGQVVTIALVVACGIGVFVATRTTFNSLTYAQTAFYERQSFADAWITVERAPRRVEGALRELEGIATVSTRVVGAATLPLPGLPSPATAHVQSLPEPGEPPLNTLHLVRGRLPSATANDEVVVNVAFAEAHRLLPGSTLPAVINGRHRTLRVVGIGMSPEWVLVLPPGSLTVADDRFGVLFMRRRAVASAFDLDGSFNSVAVRLEPGASTEAAVDRLERVLAPYGMRASHGRSHQPSHYILRQELTQLEGMAGSVPMVFLLVAAFLLHVVLGRVIQLQRGQIATLKAVGYSGLEVGTHYLKLASVVVLIGGASGVLLGKLLGIGMTSMYATFFRFPDLVHRLDAGSVSTALLVSTGAGLIGALFSVRSVLRLPPAEAMRPAGPSRYTRGVLDRLGLLRFVGSTGRMVARELGRRPARLGLSVLGIAAGVGINLVGLYFNDAMSYLVDVHMHESQRWDMQVALHRPAPDRAARELAHLPGVIHAEGLRAVPVRMRAGAIERDVVLQGYAEGSTLQRVLDMEGRPATIPATGLLLTTKLAEVLGVQPGQLVTLEVREGDQPTIRAVVAGLVEEPFGMAGHARAETLYGLLGQEPTTTSIVMTVDPERADDILDRLEDMPNVAGVVRLDQVIKQFREQSAANMWVMTLIFIIATTAIVVGIVYNNARVTLSSKERDLASMRVLGYTRAEISAVLLGELAVHVLLAIPLGLVLGVWMCGWIASQNDPEAFRLPIILSARSYALSAAVTLLAATASAILVRRKIDRFDLTAVLKSRE